MVQGVSVADGQEVSPQARVRKESNEDYALVVGIQDYPGFIGEDALKGPVNDAKAFHEWVTRPNAQGGGGVPLKNARLLTQPCGDCKDVPPGGCPGRFCVEAEFLRLWEFGKQNARRKLGEKVGRRLYIFLAGPVSIHKGEARPS